MCLEEDISQKLTASMHKHEIRNALSEMSMLLRPATYGQQISDLASQILPARRIWLKWFSGARRTFSVCVLLSRPLVAKHAE